MQRIRIYSTIIICVIAMAIWVTPAVADGVHDSHTEATEHHDSDGHHFKNGLAFFLGVTNEEGHGTEPTWGLEYARALSPRWNIGGLIDYAGGEQRNALIAPMVTFKPVGGLVFLAAPGVEYHNGRGQVEPHLLKADAPAVDEDETYFVLRLGVANYFHVGSRYGIGPAVNVDFVNGHEVLVYGVNFEVMF